MDMSEIIKQMDDVLSEAPTFTEMTRDQFEAYCQDQIAKGKKESENDKEAATKRFDHLRANIERLMKASWEGSNGERVEMYREPNLTRYSDQTEKEVSGTNTGATMADGQSFAASGGAQGFAAAKNFGDAVQNLNKSISTMLGSETKTKTETEKQPFRWPSNINDASFNRDGVEKRAADWGLDSEKAS